MSRAGDLHPVEAAALGEADRVRGLELVRDADIQITLVLFVGPIFQKPRDSLSLLNGQNIAEIEYGLLPVCVLGMGASGEADGLVARGKVNIKPRNQCMDEIVASGDERVWSAEAQVRRVDRVEINREDWARIGDQSLHLDGIDKGLCQGDLFHR